MVPSIFFDHVFDAAIDRHLPASRLSFGLRVGGVRRSLSALRPVLPDAVLVIGLNVAFGHRPSLPLLLTHSIGLHSDNPGASPGCSTKELTGRSETMTA